MVQRDFQAPVRAKPVSLSGGQFRFVVEALYDGRGNFAARPKPVQEQREAICNRAVAGGKDETNENEPGWHHGSHAFIAASDISTRSITSHVPQLRHRRH
jgi:hypothetical protein